MAGYLMSKGEIDCVIVGADRIAANGDTANKVGTHALAILARRFGVPFYVAAPSSPLDASLPDGAGIPIEQRAGDEVTSFAGARVAPEGVDAYNPAFDVTPAELVDAIVTERGVHRPPFRFGARA
jgi:methylthioribose-1-phosphate isomerase